MGCNTCGGDCGGCTQSSDCQYHGGLMMTVPELDFLKQMAVLPFLPVARKLGEETPFYYDPQEPDRDFGNLLLCLEKKGLITLDYDKPIAGIADPHYADYPLFGSMALTLRGQRVLELLDIQGIQEE